VKAPVSALAAIVRRAMPAALPVLACLAGLAAVGCTDGTTPDCSDAQCLPVLVEAGPTDAPDDAADAAAAPEPDGG
jgi:hypothetical protein